MRKLSGLCKYTNIVLKRGYTQDRYLWEWRSKVITPKANDPPIRRDVAIILLNEKREPVLTWKVLEAWISKWESGPMSAKTNDVLVETVELVHEGLELL